VTSWIRRWGHVTSSLCSRSLLRGQANNTSRDHQKKGGPCKEDEEVGHDLLFLVEPGCVDRKER
jgi:hypothetical protein